MSQGFFFQSSDAPVFIVLFEMGLKNEDCSALILNKYAVGYFMLLGKLKVLVYS